MSDLTREQFKARTAELLAEEANGPERWWWLSFADNEHNRGVVIVRARGMLNAVREASRRKINPGGEVVGFPLDDGQEPGIYANLLLTKDGAEIASKVISGEGLASREDTAAALHLGDMHDAT